MPLGRERNWCRRWLLAVPISLSGWTRMMAEKKEQNKKSHKYFLGSGSGTVYPGYFPAVFALVTFA